MLACASSAIAQDIGIRFNTLKGDATTNVQPNGSHFAQPGLSGAPQKFGHSHGRSNECLIAPPSASG